MELKTNKPKIEDMNLLEFFSHIKIASLYKIISITSAILVATFYGGMQLEKLLQNSSKIINKEEQIELMRNQIKKIEIQSSKFDQQSAKEDIEFLLNPQTMSESTIFRKKCEEIINFHEYDSLQKRDYETKAALQAIEICQKAKDLNQDNQKIYFLLTIAYFKNKEYEKFTYELMKLANENYPIAQRKLGLMYLLGDLVQQDYINAKKLLFMAVENGDLGAKAIIDSNLLTTVK